MLNQAEQARKRKVKLVDRPLFDDPWSGRDADRKDIDLRLRSSDSLVFFGRKSHVVARGE